MEAGNESKVHELISRASILLDNALSTERTGWTVRAEQDRQIERLEARNKELLEKLAHITADEQGWLGALSKAKQEGRDEFIVAHHHPIITQKNGEIERLNEEIERLHESLETQKQLTADERKRFDDEHCRDCCCAKLWAALGNPPPSSVSLPQQVTQLLAERDLLKARIEIAMDTLK